MIREASGDVRKFTRTGAQSFSCKGRFGQTSSFQGDFHMHNDGVYSYQSAGSDTVTDCSAQHQTSTRNFGDKSSVRTRGGDVPGPSPKPDDTRKTDDKVEPVKPGDPEKIEGATIKRDAKGNITHIKYANGKTRDFTYDENDNIQSQTINEPGKGARTYTKSDDGWDVTNSQGRLMGKWHGDFAMYGNGKYAYQDEQGRAHDVTAGGADQRRADDANHAIEHRKQKDDMPKPKVDDPNRVLERPITTEASFDRAALEAARDGRPMLLVMGKGDDPATQKALKDAKDAALRADGKTQILFVDTDKVDPNSTMGRFSKTVAEMHGTPYLQVLTQQQKTGEGKPLKIDTPVYESKGATLNAGDLRKALETAQKTQGDRKMTGLPDPASIKDPEIPKPKPKTPNVDPDTLPLDDPYKLNGGKDRKDKPDKVKPFKIEDLLLPDPFDLNGGKGGKGGKGGTRDWLKDLLQPEQQFSPLPKPTQKLEPKPREEDPKPREEEPKPRPRPRLKEDDRRTYYA